MTALPPAGWFPDPEAADRWRWWDGNQWAPPGFGYPQSAGYDPAGFARALEDRARTASLTGKWLRYLFVANALSMLVFAVGALIAFRGGFHLFANDSEGVPQIPHDWVVLQLGWAPTSIVNFAMMALFIAWMYHAGKVADLQGLPRARDRILGAFSPLIPIVNLWWPYEAVRDLFPPGARPNFLLRWWINYLVVPFAVFVSLFIAVAAGSVVVSCFVLVAVAGALIHLAALGWQLVCALDETYARPD